MTLEPVLIFAAGLLLGVGLTYLLRLGTADAQCLEIVQESHATTQLSMAEHNRHVMAIVGAVLGPVDTAPTPSTQAPNLADFTDPTALDDISFMDQFLAPEDRADDADPTDTLLPSDRTDAAPLDPGDHSPFGIPGLNLDPH